MNIAFYILNPILTFKLEIMSNFDVQNPLLIFNWDQI